MFFSIVESTVFTRVYATQACMTRTIYFTPKNGNCISLVYNTQHKFDKKLNESPNDSYLYKLITSGN